jgi:hypothetical protein
MFLIFNLDQVLATFEDCHPGGLWCWAWDKIPRGGNALRQWSRAATPQEMACK